MKTTESRWNFPRADGSRSHGFKEAGIATFSGEIMPSLVREICQNSLDAADNSGLPVKVEFERYDIRPDEIPGQLDFARAVGRALPYWNGQRNQEVSAHLRRVSQILRKERSVSVLRCSDFATTGLRGAYADRIDDWTRLTKLDGGATKSGVSAGSYGIGKNAPFAASALRMVFYRTLTDEPLEGGRAAQGIVYLPAFPEDRNRELSTQTLGIGYYGNPGGGGELSNQPVAAIPLLDRLCRRTAIGTDVFVFGFHDKKSWMEEVAAEVLESFILAVHKGTLEVSVADGAARMAITQETLPDVTARLARKARNAVSYYRILTEPEAVQSFERDFHGKGTLRLRLLSDTVQPLNRKVLVARSGNMKILAIDRMRGHLNFTGILQLEGVELNKFFRALETPQHNGWQPDRDPKDPRQAKKYVQELRSWVRDTVANASAMTTADRMSVTGLSKNLRAAEGSEPDGPQEELRPQVRLIVPGDQQVPDPGQQAVVRRTGGRADPDGSGSTLRGHGQLGLPRRRPAHRRRRGEGGSAEMEPGAPGGPGPQVVGLAFVRLVQTDDGKARLILEPKQDVSRGAVMLHIVGDNGTVYRAGGIRSAKCSGSTSVWPAEDRIRFENLPGGVRTAVDLVLDVPLPYAMKAVVYEDQ